MIGQPVPCQLGAGDTVQPGERGGAALEVTEITLLDLVIVRLGDGLRLGILIGHLLLTVFVILRVPIAQEEAFHRTVLQRDGPLALIVVGGSVLVGVGQNVGINTI